MEPLRVLAIMDGRTVTGPLRQLASVVGPLRDAGIDFQVAVFRRGRPVEMPHVDFLRAHGCEPHILLDTGAFDRAPLRQFRALTSTFRPQVVQTHGYRPTAIAWLARRGRSWRWAGWFHGSTTENLKVRLYHEVDRMLLPSADRVVVVAPSQAGRFPRARHKLSIIPNASLPTSRTDSPQGELIKSGIRSLPAPRLGVIGRLSPEKGVDLLLAAMALLQSMGHDVSLAIAGDGPERGSLEQQAQRLGIAGRVAFLGLVQDVAAVYESVDAIVLPSRSEGLPNTLLEGLRYDCPVVATSVGAIPVVLEDPQAGIVVPPESAERLAGGIERILAEGRTDAARAARARTVARFSLEARVQEHLRLYQLLTGP